MELPDHSINYHGVLTAATACAVGDVMIPNAGATAYVLATTAARAGRGSEAVALSAYGGTGTGNVRLAQNGILPASKSGLAVDAGPDRKLVRCSALGRIERVSSYTAGDDIIGFAELDGRVHLMFGLPFALIASAAAMPGGSVGDLQTKASATTFAGLSPGAANNIVASNGSAWVVQAGVVVPSGASGDVITNDGAGGLSNTPTLGAAHGGTGLTAPGTSGNVLTSNGTAWTSSAPAASGAPVGASYVVVALDGTLTAERRLQGSTTIGLTDGGANGDITVAIVNGSITNTHVNASAAIAYSKLNLASSIVNADVSGSAAIASSKLAPPGATTQVISNQGGAFSASSNFTHDNSGNIAASSSVGIGGGTQHTSSRIRFAYPGGSPVVLIGLKDSGSNDRSALTAGAGDGLTFGNTSMNYTALGVDGQESMTSSWQMTVNSTNRITAPVAENLALFGSTSSVPASITRMIFIGNSAAAPTTLTSPPTGGGLLYSEAGAGRWQGTSGTRTTFGPAEPHCKKCGRDFAHEWENVISNEYLMVCVPCMLVAIEKLGADLNNFTERRLAA